MLPKQIRLDLRRRRDFFSTAKTERTQNLTAFWGSIESPPLRIAIIVKKRAGKTVERAKIRRILRAVVTEVARERLADFQHSIGLVLLPRGKRQTFVEYKQQVDELISRVIEKQT